MEFLERIETRQKKLQSYMGDFDALIEALENNYKAVMHINDRIEHINEGAWAYGFLSQYQRAEEIQKNLRLQRRVLRLRARILNKIAQLSHERIGKIQPRIEVVNQMSQIVQMEYNTKTA